MHVHLAILILQGGEQSARLHITDRSVELSQCSEELVELHGVVPHSQFHLEQQIVLCEVQPLRYFTHHLEWVIPVLVDTGLPVLEGHGLGLTAGEHVEESIDLGRC
jgi:hypothetical protein